MTHIYITFDLYNQFVIILVENLKIGS